MSQPSLFLTIIGVAILSIGSLTRAGSIEDRDGKTIIHVVSAVLPDPGNTEVSNRADIAGLREFQRRFPKIFAERYRDKYKADPKKYGKHNWDNVELEFHAFAPVQVEGVETDLLAIAGELAPDILYVNFRKSDNYIQNRFLYPLDKPEDGYLTSMSQEEINFRVHPKLWPVIKRKGPDGQKYTWAMPFRGALGKVLLFRKDLFEEKGIPFPTEKWTWDDMLAAARKLTDPKKGTYATFFYVGKQESWNWVTFLWSAGGDAMQYDEATDQWKCTFDSPEAAKALDFYVRLNSEKWTDADGKIQRGYASRDPGESADKWARGLIGMSFDYIGGRTFTSINPEITGMVPVPLGPTGIRGAELNCTMMGLFNDIKEPAVRDMAWEYMKFYDCEDSVAIKTKVMVEGGLGRFINPEYLRRFGYPEIERLSPPGWARNFEIAIETGKPEPFGKNSNFAYEMMTFPIQDALDLAYHDKLPADDTQRLEVLHGLLKDANARANEEMIGIIAPQERTKRRVKAAIMLAAIVVAFALVFRRIVKTFQPPRTEGIVHQSWAFRKYAWSYVLLVPSILTILLWQYIPLARGSVMAFQDYKLIGNSVWVGLDNFGDLIANKFWWYSIINSIRYSVLVIALTFLPPMILAILLQEVPKGKLLFRTIFYLPAVITGLVTVLLWRQFYDPSPSGVLNAVVMNIPAGAYVGIGIVLFVLTLMFSSRMAYHEMWFASLVAKVVAIVLLSYSINMASDILFIPDDTIWQKLAHLPGRLLQFHTEAYRWRDDPSTAMIACVIPMVWAGMGPGCLIYLAALKGIPDDYYEAADIDGATFIDKILLVVFPILKPLIIINFVGVFIGSFYGAAGNILAMTGGGANTEVADLHLWYKAFTYLKFGSATAMAWMLGFMLIGFTVYQLRILSRVEFKAAGTQKK